MGQHPESLRQVSWSILQRDFAGIEALLRDERRRTGNPRISQSDIARSVVAVGVRELLRARNIACSASSEVEEVA